jgi:hypothetical protein
LSWSTVLETGIEPYIGKLVLGPGIKAYICKLIVKTRLNSEKCKKKMKEQHRYGHVPVQVLITIHVLAYPVLVMVICTFWCQHAYGEPPYAYKESLHAYWDLAQNFCIWGLPNCK